MALIALLATLAPLSAAHAQRETASTLVDVVLTCNLEACDDPRFVERLIDLTGLQPGMQAGETELAAAVDHLQQTGWFHRIDVERVASGDGVVVTIDAAAATIIRDLRIHAGFTLASEIRRRIFLRSGQPWTADPATVARQEEAITEYFERRGRWGSTVDITPRDVDEHVVDLRFDVDRGQRLSVTNVYVRGHQAMSYGQIRDIVLGELNLVRTFTTVAFERAQTALIDAYRERGYLQARVVWDEPRIHGDDGTVDLFLVVDEGERWDVQIDGNRLFDDDQLLRRLSFYNTGFIDDEEIRLAAWQIISAYETIGHFFATVTVTRRVDDEVQVLRFEVDEGLPSEVRDIRFEGLAHAQPRELRALMGTTEYDILSSGGYLQRSLLANDIGAIERWYRERGFLSVRVPRVVLVGDDGGRDLYVTIHLDEGEQTLVDDVVFEPWQPPAEVTRGLSLAPGAAFTPDALAADQSTLAGRLAERGLAFAEIEAVCLDAVGFEVPCVAASAPRECRLDLVNDREDACAREWNGGILVEACALSRADPACTPRDGIDGDAVSVQWRITPGPVTRFGHVFVRGAFDTRDRVLRAELPFEYGDVFDFDTLLRGQANLRSLGLFDAVRVQSVWVDDPDSEERVGHVVVQVEEGRSQFVEHRVSLESRVATNSELLLIFSNEPQYRNLNFLGRAEELRLAGNFDIDVLNRDRLADGELRAGLAAIWIDPRVRMFGTLQDPWESRTELAWDYDLLTVAPAPLVRELRFAWQLREEFESIRGLFIEMGLSVRRTESLDQSDPEVVSNVFESALILSLIPRITWDRRDNPLNPSRGTFHQVEVELADDLLGVFGAEKFTRMTLRNSGFVPFGAGFVFGANLRFGLAAGGISDGFAETQDVSLPLSERFSLGGVTSLRGFAEGDVSSPLLDDFGGDVVLNGTLELRYPFLRDAGLQGALFVDSGQLAPDVADLRPDAFRTTTGVGLRWLIADIIPFVIDYGAVIARRPGERFGRLHFNIGYTF